jgi:hypothetical protein
MNAQLKPQPVWIQPAGLIAVTLVPHKHVYATTTPRSTMPHLDNEIAIPSRRYIGKYYWSNYFGHWDKVVDVDEQDKRWQMAKTDRSGHVIEKPRWHNSNVSAMCFADRPFIITRG